MQRKSILFVYVNYSSFVKADFEILSTFANVTKYQFKPGKGILNTGIEVIKQFFYLLINIWQYDAVFVWFADYHSFLPALFTKFPGKKSFIVIGGYEVCRIKSLNYGALCSKFRGFFCVGSMKLSTVNLTVSSYIDRKVKFIVPDSKRQLVYNCVDFVQLPAEKTEKEHMILTVGLIENKRSFLLKGIDSFIDIARLLPDYQFVIIGLDKLKLSSLLASIPVNVSTFERVSHDELPGYYRKAMFYLQLSRSESFGVSIGEAMLYGCVPIVTNEGGMPELVGETGYVVKRDSSKISQLIRDVTINLPNLQSGVSSRILSGFSREKREEALVMLVSNLLNEKN
jgi:glycosyltransferase involved in cell wall biosynthesis